MDEENIKVVVRVRPLNLQEKKEGDIACAKPMSGGKEVQVKVGPLDAQTYRCTKCFPNDTTQLQFFEESGIANMLDSAMEGYRCCAFAFGQTGAGKTFTMLGNNKGHNHRDKQHGMVARSLEYIFNNIEAQQSSFKVKISCLEIYHEHVYDLFAEEKERVSLPVREHAAEGFFLEGCKMIECTSYDVACQLLEVAMQQRKVGSHDTNSRSSRSHCITDIYIESAASDEEAASEAANRNEDMDQGFVLRGRMSLVDLAGSERLKNTKSTGKVLQEAGFINRSLYVLGKVIAGLVRTNGDLNHKDVPFRDSKLTKLLIGSLGGKARTLLIACISEAKSSQAETLRTLKFSMSCARIKNKPVKFLDPQEKLILDLREEIRRLSKENKKLRSTISTAPGGSQLLLEDGEDAHHGNPRARSSQDHNRKSPSRSPNKKAPNFGLGSHVSAQGSPMKKKKSSAAPGGGVSPTPSQHHQEFLSQHGMIGPNGAAVKKKKLTKKKKKVGAGAASPSKAKRQHSSVHDLLGLVDDDGNNMHNHNVDENSSVGGGSLTSTGSVRPRRVEDMMRNSVHPMVFKGDNSEVPLLKEYDYGNKGGVKTYDLANNFERQLEAQRLDQLERRMARMERQEQERISMESQRPNEDGAIAVPAPVARHPIATNKKKPPTSTKPIAVQQEQAYLKKKIAKEKPKPGKEVSPYIMHMIKNTKKAKVHMPLRQKEPAAVQQQQQQQQQSSVANYVGEDDTDAEEEHPAPPPAASSSSPSKYEDMTVEERKIARKAEIDRELEELGLGPSSSVTSTNSTATGKSKPAAASKASKGPAKKSSASKLPVIPAHQKAKQQSGRSSAGAQKAASAHQSKEDQLERERIRLYGGEMSRARSKLTAARYVPPSSADDEQKQSARRMSSRGGGEGTTSLPLISAGRGVSGIGSRSSRSRSNGELGASALDYDTEPANESRKTVAPTASDALDDRYAGGGIAALTSPKKVAASPKYSSEGKTGGMSPAAVSISNKLNALQQSLQSTRIQMEDQPGLVTAEEEERHQAFENEALSMQQQLEQLLGSGQGTKSGEGFQKSSHAWGENDDEEEDFSSSPAPNAVRVANTSATTTTTTTATASLGKKAGSRTGSRAGSEGGSKSRGGQRSRGGTRGHSRGGAPRPATSGEADGEDDDDDDYGDDDYEDDEEYADDEGFESAPVTPAPNASRSTLVPAAVPVPTPDSPVAAAAAAAAASSSPAPAAQSSSSNNSNNPSTNPSPSKTANAATVQWPSRDSNSQKAYGDNANIAPAPHAPTPAAAAAANDDDDDDDYGYDDYNDPDDDFEESQGDDSSPQQRQKEQQLVEQRLEKQRQQEAEEAAEEEKRKAAKEREDQQRRKREAEEEAAAAAAAAAAEVERARSEEAQRVAEEAAAAERKAAADRAAAAEAAAAAAEAKRIEEDRIAAEEAEAEKRKIQNHKEDDDDSEADYAYFDDDAKSAKAPVPVVAAAAAAAATAGSRPDTADAYGDDDFEDYADEEFD